MDTDGRVRILRILELLKEQSYLEHPLTIAEITEELKERWGLEAYRITVQKDIAALIDAGYEIQVKRSTQNQYYYDGRLFQLAELKLLVDAVESSKFITEKKSREIAGKLVTLAGPNEAGRLKRNISITDRVKAGNEQIYYITDKLNEAINRNRKVSFYYFAYTADKKKELKNNGEPYIFSPYTLTWNSDYYYAVGWSDKHDRIVSFRIDRIYSTPEVLAERAVPKPKNYSIGNFTQKAFQMFDGEHVRIQLLCENSTMNTLTDHFGNNVKTEIVDEYHFRMTAEISLGPTFFAWVFEFGGKIKIMGPQSAKDAYAELLRKAAE